MAEMTREEVNAFLDHGPRWAVLSTLDRNGYPHSVPLGYFRLGDELVVSARGQRKLNVARNSKVGLVVEVGEATAELKGVVIRGDGTLVEEPAPVLELAREGARRRGTAEADLPTEVRPGAAYIRISPKKIASWDNSKR